MIKLFRKKTSISEIEAIANRKLMEALINISVSRSDQNGEPFLETARVIRCGVIARQKRHKIKKWQAVIQKAIGLSDVMKTQHDDLLAIAERFKVIGEASLKQDRRYHYSVLMLEAKNLDEMADKLTGTDKSDIKEAASSVRMLAKRFSDNKE